MRFLIAAVLVAGAAFPAAAYKFQAPPPLSHKSEDYEKYFNLSFKDGHQQDSFTRRVQHLYNNLEGKGAIRDGLRHAEDAVLEQPGGRPDSVQSSLLGATVRADSAAALIYGLLREEAKKVDKGWNKVRDAKADTETIESTLAKTARALEAALQAGEGADAPSQMGGIIAAVKKIEDSVRLMDEAGEHVAQTRKGVTALLPHIDEAARWHAGSHKAAGGNAGNNPTEAALRNLAGAVQSATELGEKAFAVMGQIQGDSREKLLAAAKTDAVVQQAAAAVDKAAASGSEFDKRSAAKIVAEASAAAAKGGGAKAGCAACGAKSASRAFGSKNEAEKLPELRSFIPRVALGNSAAAITADGGRKVRSEGKMERKLSFGNTGLFDGR